MDPGAEMAVEERKVAVEIGASTGQRSGRIEEIGQAVGQGGQEASPRSQADGRIASLRRRHLPEAPRQHQRHAQERRTQLEKAAAEDRFNAFGGNPARQQFLEGRQQGRRVEGVQRYLIAFCHVRIAVR
ncbi:hypothetical protein D3C85_1264540 [compost metagenome]